MNSNVSVNNVEIKPLSKYQLEQRLQEIFDYANSNTEALVEIYKLIFPDMDNIKKIEGHPVAGKNLWTYIWRLFMQLDRKCHPEEFAGSIWINKGWGMNSGLTPWSIDISNCRVIYS
ncbi:MAG: hypothetical protein HQK67_09640 [Desulfamplus sp.]|nr:hypothetical protein [Desulfamplus sp.]